ncbi:putative GIY-YIG superfamily endonuclease [Nocardioides ginsengisegetis]|uniref:Putative GIY-YIG superfamily endonuclease n=1 Tax=Nocardioides ginsengisegetis TaxID=661491 RepID=A0A7W3PBL9_9ACTN|nr:GIY-YIG nuclease family protein [Nocardioides ginsengisegetis]MBA8801713.1 putative GIY-YIG superfamily endonuclease [Nocardioides ginsengisegetis]MBA8805574.1 putative GIY-YIG superfamily endonuclease [Nocardioides ginsengisegetis]
MNRHQGETLGEWRARCDAMAERHEAAENYVYRAFDDAGRLLYIGCSLNVEQRLTVHRRESDWFRYCNTLRLAGPYRRSEAMRLERDAIESEGSYFNSPMSNMRLYQLGSPEHVTATQRLERYLAARADREVAA